MDRRVAQSLYALRCIHAVVCLSDEVIHIGGQGPILRNRLRDEAANILAQVELERGFTPQR